MPLGALGPPCGRCAGAAAVSEAVRGRAVRCRAVPCPHAIAACFGLLGVAAQCPSGEPASEAVFWHISEPDETCLICKVSLLLELRVIFLSC